MLWRLTIGSSSCIPGTVELWVPPLTLGPIVISVWAVLNLIPSAVILANTMFLDGNSLAIYQILDDEQVEALSTDVRTSINSIAVYANGLNVALSLLALFVVQRGLNKRVP
jgi:hypothetical protein